MPRAEQRELTIDALAAGGDGVGRLADGTVTFVRGGAPGERVLVDIDRRAHLARGRVLEVLTPSPARVEPVCPYVARCGGCDWMHLSEDAQREGHRAILAGALEHARVGDLPPIVTHAAPASLGYRTRARLSLVCDRRGARVGYKSAASHDVTSIDRCVVLDASIAPLLTQLPEVFRGARGTGDVSIARGAGGRPVAAIAFRGEVPPSTWAALDAHVTGGAWAGAELALGGAAAPARFGDPRPVIAGADGSPMVIAAASFAQPSDEGGAALARRVDELSRARSPRTPDASQPSPTAEAPRRALELFCGSGTLSVLLARDATSFLGVEISPQATEAARANLKERGLDAAASVKVATADADAFDIPPATTVVVLDPPRSGAPGAAKKIAASSVRSVVYVSCDPVTLARDLATLLAPGKLAITDIETFELFPQTSHVETVVRLARVKRSG